MTTNAGARSDQEPKRHSVRQTRRERQLRIDEDARDGFDRNVCSVPSLP